MPDAARRAAVDQARGTDSWWSKERRVALAQQLAHEKGRSDQERAALQTRLLRKWMGK
jgi:hypothetical protein